MSEAARVGDPIAHTSALTGLLTGLAVGALAGVLIAGTGGLAAAAVIGAAAAGGAGIGEVIGSLSWCTSNTGNITTGPPDVYINGRPAVRSSLSIALCAKHAPPPLVAEGSSTVYINGMPASRVGDHTTCGAKINAGSSNVFIGGQAEATEEIDPEVPGWLRNTILGLGVVSVTGLVRYGVIGLGRLGLGMAGGAGGGFGGHWAGGKVFGEGSDWQKLTMLAGALIGGMTGMRGGRHLDVRYPMNAAARQYRRDYLNNKYGRSGNLNKDINYRANQKTAYDYFKSKGYPDRKTKEFMNGIDFNKPVYVETINSGKTLWQYQAPGGRQGNWYSPTPKAKPTELGISPKGKAPDTKIVEFKQLNIYQTKQKTEFLRSTAAPVKDTWSIKGKSISTRGGAQQLFTPDNKGFKPPNP